MNTQGQMFSMKITLHATLCIEGDRVVMKNKNNVLAFALLDNNGEFFSSTITKLYFIKPQIEEVLKKSLKHLKDGNRIQESINIEVNIEILPEYYFRDVVLLQMFDYFSQKNSKYTTVKLLKHAKEGRMLLVTINDQPVGFGILDKEKSKILKTYLDSHYKNLGIEQIFNYEG